MAAIMTWILPFWIQHLVILHKKKPSLIHSDSTWWLQPSEFFHDWFWPSWIQPYCFLPLEFTQNCHLGLHHLNQKFFDSNLIHSHSTWWWQQSCILAAILNSAILDSAILHSETNLIFKLIHSDSTWWWQPSWILPCQIEPLPSWIQTPCYLLSDLLKNTLSPLWFWIKLIQFDSTSFILT